MKLPPLVLLFTVFFWMFAVNALAQKKGEPEIEIPDFTIDDKTQKAVYNGVVQQKGSKDTLYEKALAWAMKYYKNPTNVLREKDKVKGSLKARARFYVYHTDPKKGTKTKSATIEYTLTIAFKEGRYRYEITTINIKGQSYKGIEIWIDRNKKEYNYATASYLVQVDEDLKKVINDFKTAIGKTEKSTESW